MWDLAPGQADLVVPLSSSEKLINSGRREHTHIYLTVRVPKSLRTKTRPSAVCDDDGATWTSRDRLPPPPSTVILRLQRYLGLTATRPRFTASRKIKRDRTADISHLPQDKLTDVKALMPLTFIILLPVNAGTATPPRQ